MLPCEDQRSHYFYTMSGLLRETWRRRNPLRPKLCACGLATQSSTTCSPRACEVSAGRTGWSRRSLWPLGIRSVASWFFASAEWPTFPKTYRNLSRTGLPRQWCTATHSGDISTRLKTVRSSWWSSCPLHDW
jgi:hypothetical protein